MKNVTIHRGLVCMTDTEFNRVTAEVARLESVNLQLTQQLEESTKRVSLLEDTLRLTETELNKLTTTAK
jgi:hypothetical protein